MESNHSYFRMARVWLVSCGQTFKESYAIRIWSKMRPMLSPAIRLRLYNQVSKKNLISLQSIQDCRGGNMDIVTSQ